MGGDAERRQPVAAEQPWRIYTAADGLPAADVQTLFVDSAGDVWVGTSAGLALIRGGRVQRRVKPAVLAGSILGLVEDREGWLWLTTANRVLRVRRDRLAADAVGPGDWRDYDTTDGLVSREGVERHRTVVADRRGHVWLAVNGAIQHVDPRRSARHLPALVHIKDVTADDRVVPPAAVYQIPSGGHRVTLSYAGLSLTVPERVRFRYMLDGLDRDWSREVTERQAIYSNLPPGTYTFRVMASNSDGVWNSQPATVMLDVAPMFWQTRWFQAGAVLLIVAAGWAAYRFRLRQIARRLNSRFEERLAERTRLAQELHDTLLQGVLSASMQLHLAIDRMPQEAPARALARPRHVLDGARRRRRPSRRARPACARRDGDDLELAFARVPRDFGAHTAATCRIVVQGSPRPMHPLIRDEVYRIGREALVNALRHSGAREIELAIDYQPSHVCVTVRDDGCGIDEQVLRVGRKDHWGLLGMQERADGIGARLRVWSRRDGGTEVELTVPNDVAFTGSARPAWRRAWSAWRAFRTDGERCRCASSESELIMSTSPDPCVERRRSSTAARGYRRGDQQPARHVAGGIGDLGTRSDSALPRASARRDADGSAPARRERHRRDDHDSRRVSRRPRDDAHELRRRRRDRAGAARRRARLRAEEPAAQGARRRDSRRARRPQAHSRRGGGAARGTHGGRGV